jgi:enoyl-CoA hydratase/carnithine racemase
MSQEIKAEQHEAVLLVTIDAPDKMNALDFAANDRLIEVWREFEDDGDLRAAVITGAGKKAFCSGADLKTYTMAYAQRTPAEFRDQYTNGPGIGGITRGMEIYKPIVAAINGFAISGGLEIALAADIRLCSPNAEFAHQDVRWGFHPCDGGCVRLPQIVGLGNAMEMILSGDRIDADHAVRIGLVNRVVPQESLLDEALQFAGRLATRAPLAQRFAKEVMLRSYSMPMEEALRLESRSFHDVSQTADLEEGTRAFREKRPPNFKGA